MQRHVVRTFSISAARMAGGEDAHRWVYNDTAASDNGSPAGGKTATEPRGGLTSRVRNHVRPRDPGAVSTVSPHRMTIDDVVQTVEQSGGGGFQLTSPGVSTEWTDEIMAEDTSANRHFRDVRRSSAYEKH